MKKMCLSKFLSQKLQRKLELLQAILDLNQLYQWLQLGLEKAQENLSCMSCKNNSQDINININLGFINQRLVTNLEVIWMGL